MQVGTTGPGLPAPVFMGLGGSRASAPQPWPQALTAWERMKASGFIPFPSVLVSGVTDTKSHGVAKAVPVSIFALAEAVLRARGGEPSWQVPRCRGDQRETVSSP